MTEPSAYSKRAVQSSPSCESCWSTSSAGFLTLIIAAPFFPRCAPGAITGHYAGSL